MAMQWLENIAGKKTIRRVGTGESYLTNTFIGKTLKGELL
jgi:hypothetical protein